MSRRRSGTGSPKGSQPASWVIVRREAEACRGCDLWRHATQTVFGNGPPRARFMFVGEQPGDTEDRQGVPFVGPAGQLLKRALMEAGIDSSDVYLTNVVKHFKWEPRGKRRIHKKPTYAEMQACQPWLDAEIELIKPRAIVALGATAARALIGRSARVSRDRGQPVPSSLAQLVSLTVHPSSILRSPDSATRAQATAQFIDDLRRIAAAVEGLSESRGRHVS